jgi:hypothetical protein
MVTGAEPDPAELTRRYGADTSIPDWHRRLLCSRCGGRAIDFVLTGGKEVRSCRGGGPARIRRLCGD